MIIFLVGSSKYAYLRTLDYHSEKGHVRSGSGDFVPGAFLPPAMGGGRGGETNTSRIIDILWVFFKLKVK